ncbi:hypothetical protein ACHQM5_023669 [Ranunculus cassubicifolius]
MYLSNQFSVLSDCYIFKNRLLEYTQRKCILPPVYDTIKEGPSHEFSFKSVVTVADISYNSLPGFSNHKTAEQSAAEIALTELAKSGPRFKKSILGGMPRAPKTVFVDADR